MWIRCPPRGAAEPRSGLRRNTRPAACRNGRRGGNKEEGFQATERGNETTEIDLSAHVFPLAKWLVGVEESVAVSHVCRNS